MDLHLTCAIFSLQVLGICSRQLLLSPRHNPLSVGPGSACPPGFRLPELVKNTPTHQRKCQQIQEAVLDKTKYKQYKIVLQMYDDFLS